MAACASLCGVLAVHRLPALPNAAWCVPAALLALLALRQRATHGLLWFIAAAVWATWCAHERLADRLPATEIGRDFKLVGWVDGFPDVAPGQVTFAFAVADPRAPGVPKRVRLTWYEPPAAITAGDALRLEARLRPPRGTSNPGGFDYEQWLLVNGYGATGYVRAAEAAPLRGELRARWLRFRATLAQRIAAAAPDADAAALLSALALGERYLFTPQHWADFRRTGTSHLVAVSGMHVALLGVAVFALLRWLCLRLPAPLSFFDLEVAAGASLIVTAFYAALTGFAVPAQRSLVMIAIALAFIVGRRCVSAWQTLAATVLVVLAWDPFAPLTASFWLSFTAVAILLGLAAPRGIGRFIADRVRAALHVGAEFATLQWSIGIALLPITAWCFGEIASFGPVVNLLAIPWFNVVLVPLTLLATVVASIDPLVDLAPPLVRGVGWLARETVAWLHLAAGAPAAALPLPQASWLALALAVGAMAFAVLAPPIPGRRLAWLAMVPMFLPDAAVPQHGEARAVVLDVGHGLAVIVETRTHRLVFDAGPAFPSGFDSGAATVLPALRASGRRDLSTLVVSHADNDHSGGAAAIVDAFPDVDVLRGPDVRAPSGRICERGQAWSWDGVRFAILHPSRDFSARGNESSCVLKVMTAWGSLLISGDIEQRGEAALPSSETAADVVVVPHHGSATSSSSAFVTSANARYAIVSAGFANRWGFPKPEVRARWERSGAAVVVTGESGAISVSIGRHGMDVRKERDLRHRYWHASVASQATD